MAILRSEAIPNIQPAYRTESLSIFVSTSALRSGAVSDCCFFWRVCADFCFCCNVCLVFDEQGKRSLEHQRALDTFRLLSDRRTNGPKWRLHCFLQIPVPPTDPQSDVISPTRTYNVVSLIYIRKHPGLRALTSTRVHSRTSPNPTSHKPPSGPPANPPAILLTLTSKLPPQRPSRIQNYRQSGVIARVACRTRPTIKENQAPVIRSACTHSLHAGAGHAHWPEGHVVVQGGGTQSVCWPVSLPGEGGIPCGGAEAAPGRRSFL